MASEGSPLLVLMFDPRGKEKPYLRRGRPQDLVVDEFGHATRDIMHPKKDRLLIRLEHFLNPNVKQPDAYEHLQRRLLTLEGEVAQGEWSTVGLDSITFAELAARKLHQYRLNRAVKEPRLWWAGSTDMLEELLMCTLGSFACNVVVVAHISEDKDEVAGTFVRNPMAPGRLQKRLASAYGELWRQYVTRNEEGDRVYLLQTQGDDRFNAASQIEAPDGSVPDYRVIRAHETAPLEPIHVILYGESGSGKSTTLGTFAR